MKKEERKEFKIEEYLTEKEIKYFTNPENSIVGENKIIVKPLPVEEKVGGIYVASKDERVYKGIIMKVSKGLESELVQGDLVIYDESIFPKMISVKFNNSLDGRAKYLVLDTGGIHILETNLKLQKQFKNESN